MTLKSLLAATMISAALAGSAALASGDGTLTADRQAEIRATLTEQGYEVRGIQMEDGMIEVYALNDGQRLELYLNEALEIVNSKIDD